MFRPNKSVAHVAVKTSFKLRRYTGRGHIRRERCHITLANSTLPARGSKIALRKLVLVLACRSLLAVHRDNMYLLSNQTQRSVTDLMPMIGARFYTQLDAALLRSDETEDELAKELENGRLFKLIVKLATINERPEVNMEPTWAETGDRYMLKLFRDYVFHHVVADGMPWLDMAHVVHCLNKLDSGSRNKICLTSRDGQGVLILSYAKLRQCLETSFGELIQSAKETV